MKGGVVATESWVEHAPEVIGQRVRQARLSTEWTLDELAERSGVSRRMIVNVESGTVNASITTLLRLSGALQLTLADLVAAPAADATVSVTRAADHQPLWRGPEGGSATLITSANTPDMVELWDWVLEPGETYASEPHRPGTRELIHIQSGSLELTVGDAVHRLRSGDAVRFNADVSHTYRVEGNRRVRFAMTVFEPLPRIRP